MSTEASRRRPARAAAIPDRVLAAIAANAWAITPDGMERVLAVASRLTITPEALEARAGRPLDNAREVTVRDGVATVPISGVLMRRADFFSRISGATSYETIATDFHAALDDRAVRAILFAIDTPGGEVNGVGELAAMFHAARAVKPMAAYVEGEGCSAGYWLASAIGDVVAAPTALVGCLGVRMSMLDTSEADAKRGVRSIEFVSSQTPQKSIDPRTEGGRARVQALVDALAAVFLGDVAAYRGLADAEAVAAQYGAGEVYVGQAALERGLVDRLGSYEQLHAELVARTQAAPGRVLFTPASSKEPTMPRARGAAAGASASAGATTDPANPAETETPETSETPSTPETEPAATEPAEGEADAGADASVAQLPTTATAAQVAAVLPTAAAALRAEGATAERARITGILAYADRGSAATIRACIEDPAVTPDAAAARILREDAAGGAQHLARLASDEAALQANGGAPKPLADADAAAKAAGRPLHPTASRVLATVSALNPGMLVQQPATTPTR